MPLNINDDMPVGRPPSGKIGSKKQPVISAPDLLAEQAAGGMAAPDVLTSGARAAMLAPDVLTSGARAAMLAPDVLSSRPADVAAPPFPLNHARILWLNKLIGGAVSQNTPGAVTGAANILTPATYARAKINAYAEITITLPSPQLVDSVGVGAHTLAGAQLLIQHRPTPSDPWANFPPGARIVPNSSAILAVLPAPVTVSDVRIIVDDLDLAGVTIGAVYAGEALQMQRPIYRGVDPATLNRVTEYTNNVSEGGQWLGRDITRQGLKTKPRWQNLDPVWLRSYFDPFASAARRLPFFYSWNPLEFPNDVAYCWTSKDIQPSITGPRNLMSVEIEMEGHA